MNIHDLYQQIILDHYREKHHYGLRPHDVAVHHVNPSCGDELTLRLKLDNADSSEGSPDSRGTESAQKASRIADISWEGDGCSISQASTSVMTDLLIGKTVEEALALYDEFQTMMESQGRYEPDEDLFDDAVAFAGVSQFPQRVKCAMLAWAAVRDAIFHATAQASDSLHPDTADAGSDKENYV